MILYINPSLCILQNNASWRGPRQLLLSPGLDAGGEGVVMMEGHTNLDTRWRQMEDGTRRKC
jgi:hypothetical protein